MNHRHSRSATRASACILGRAALAAIPLVVATGSTAWADVRCGDIIGPRASVVLQQDLRCTRGEGGITVIGPATLDLNGHRIECAPEAPRPTGIVLVGSRAIVRNGSVLSCQDGVDVTGDGRHRVEQVVVAASDGMGFRVASDGNTLRDSRSAGGAYDFFVTGDRNVLDRNGTTVEGFANARSGFVVRGAKNRLRDNVASGHDEVGFAIDGAGAGNTLTGNRSLGNGRQGFYVFAPRTTLTRNQASGNGGEGLFAGADRLKLVRNELLDNAWSGVRLLLGTEGATVSRNTALNNNRDGEPFYFDLRDDSATCANASNRWRGNVFATASASCID